MMPRFVLPLLLALIGLILSGQGAYIHAKALVAQVLLERAFENPSSPVARQSRGHGRTHGRSPASK